MESKKETTVDISSSFCTLLGLQEKAFTTLMKKECLCIGSVISDAKTKGEETVSIGVGIGKLLVRLSDMTMKFLPSDELKAAAKQAITDGVNPLSAALERALAEKLLAICGEEL
jgi:hypothetical protein